MHRLWWHSWTPPLIQLGVLLRLFLDERISADEFEVLFFPVFSGQQGLASQELYDLLQAIFYAVEDYCGDPALRGEKDLDETELRRRIEATWEPLIAIASKTSLTRNWRIVNSSGDSEPNVSLSCLADEQCRIHFEPWGTEYVLSRGDVFQVSSSAFSTGDVEVSYVAGGISLVFASDAPVTVTDRTGRVFPI
ncbi:colicin immunity domain-containing protein [Arthrobacter bambusae]|uniref:Colicin D immunity protein domain-containing protein n=1 Tax=Arthrobacter bambusae TaxID=1338426 RepID=A0AAW8D907_9MICC|nr:colicin immunity domain-containing protein [Arthrobacter bambusae]MDP9903109.1 hypothetical protein [Arthrobacter bambusae]MDQ0128897.1 hypothetical protein [Arthrobacter bambusae]MDQ0180238.1 hypothetical protein [Arthrobacter bambusae]